MLQVMTNLIQRDQPLFKYDQISSQTNLFIKLLFMVTRFFLAANKLKKILPPPPSP